MRNLPELTADDRLRYSRHLLLPDVGENGQQKLKNAHILLVGVGGLGSPAAIYLAAAGVGRLTLIDPDRVDMSNLQRQVLYADTDRQALKVEAACKRLLALNPHLEIRIIPERLDAQNALDLISQADVVVDGADNFATRYLVNDACYLAGVPNVHGSIYRFQGQMSVYAHANGPCYRCLYPEPPPPDEIPSCAEAGVLGVLPGIVGTIQATEAIKLILGIGEALIGKVLLFDALAMDFRKMKLRRDPSCALCSPSPTITTLSEYRGYCSLHSDEKDTAMNIDAETLSQRIDQGDDMFLLDVREPHEHVQIAIPGATLIPLGTLSQRCQEVPRDKEVIVYCHAGIRSLKGQQILLNHGFTDVTNLVGGIMAWVNTTHA